MRAQRAAGVQSSASPGYADLNFVIPELISTLHYSKGLYFPDLGDFDTAGAVQINYVNMLPHDLAQVTAGTLGYYRVSIWRKQPVESCVSPCATIM